MPDYNALLMQGFQTGLELKRQEGERNALAKLATGDYRTPGIGDDVERQRRGALDELAIYNPQMAMQMQERQAQQLAAQRKEQQAKLTEGKKIVGQAALQIAQLPAEQRPAAWDQQIDYLVQQGWDGLAQFKGKYSEQSLMGVISEAGLANELRTATQPSYQVIPEGGTLVNTRDHRAVSQFGVPPQPAQPQAPKIIPQRPANMTDADLISQAREAIQNGAPATEVFQQLQAWGVKP
jgi:hypothetical protein